MAEPVDSIKPIEVLSGDKEIARGILLGTASASFSRQDELNAGGAFRQVIIEREAFGNRGANVAVALAHALDAAVGTLNTAGMGVDGAEIRSGLPPGQGPAPS